MKKSIKEEQRKEQNKKYKTLIKNDLKRFRKELASGADNKTLNLRSILSIAQKNIDKSVSKKIIHKNNAARKKSRLFRLLNDLGSHERGDV